MKILLNAPHGSPLLLSVTTKPSKSLPGALNVRITVPPFTIRQGDETLTTDAASRVADFRMGLN